MVLVLVFHFAFHQIFDQFSSAVIQYESYAPYTLSESEMYKRKLSKTERQWLREQRDELQLIRSLVNARNFDYLVQPKEQPRIAFGSDQERDCLPMKGPQVSPFMRRFIPEYREYPGPLDYVYDNYRSINKKFPSRLGFSRFCSKVPRLVPTINPDFPPIGAYDVDVKKPPKQSAKPFGIGASYKKCDDFLTPAPSAYPHHVPRKQYKLEMAFNKQRKFVPAVSVICCPVNMSRCFMCKKTCRGDYWRNFTRRLDLCRSCMHKKRLIIKNCKTSDRRRFLLLAELEAFVQTRYCDFFHTHNSVKAATAVISKRDLAFKIRKENYLLLFQHDY